MSLAPSIPDHTLLRPVGRGAYGEVWLARNIMGAPRAVKIIWRRQFESDRPYDREFAGIQEYEPVSRTTDALVQVLHVGRNDAEGYFYYVMELADSAACPPCSRTRGPKEIAGSPAAALDSEAQTTEYTPRTLRSEMKRLGRLPVAECLRVAIDLAGGLACLHRHGLVHRDVKPGNIIFVNGRAKLADIGLVSPRTEGRTFVGTEGYIPPEGPGSPAADLYALGMTLYEAATGESPDRFPRTPVEWFAEGASGEALEFHEIVLKAGESFRERRYQTAGELQADLALFQSGHSVRRVRALQRRANRSRRLGLAVVIAAIVAVGSVVVGNHRVRVETQQRAREHAWREEAEQARAVAERAERRAREQLLAALLEQARANVRGAELGQRFQTLAAVRQAAAITNSPVLRQAAIAALTLPDLRFDREIRTPLDTTIAVLDPAFERLAIGRDTNAVEIRSATDNSIVATLPASVPQSARLAEWSGDGRYVAITRSGQPPAWLANVEVWDVPTARRVWQLPLTRYGACAFHPRLPRLVAAHLGNTVGVWDLENNRELARHAVTGIVHHLKFSPSGDSFVAQHRIDKAWFTSWLDAESGAVRRSTRSGWMDAIAWDPRDKFVALAARHGEIYLHDRTTGETSVLGRHKNAARSAVFSPDGAYLFTGGEELEVICWDLALRQRAFGIAERSDRIQFAGTGARCAIGTRGRLLLYELACPAAGRELSADLGASVRSAAFSPDGRWIAVGGLAGLGVWNLSRHSAPAIIAMPEHATPVFSPNSQELFAYNIERLGRWRLEGGADSPPHVKLITAPPTDRVRSAQFAGESLVLAANGGVLVYSSPDDARPEFIRLGSTHALVSSNGKWLAATKGDSISIYASRPWAWQCSVPVDSEILDHAFVPGDAELSVATASGLTWVDTRDWKTQRRLPVVLDARARVLFMPDGRSFWLVQDIRTAALYDARTFAQLLPLASGVLPLAVSADGKELLVSIDGRRLQRWDWPALRRQVEELGLSWGE